MSARATLRTALIGAATAVSLDALARRRDRARRWTRPRRLRVMNLHGTPARDGEAFRRQILWAEREFRIVDLDGALGILAGRDAAPDDPRLPVLLTFDDGLASNHAVAAPLLEERGHRGVFFIVPGFSALRGEDAFRFHYLELNSRRRLPDTRPPEEEWAPMTPEQVADLDRRGHAIGNHTMSHARLSRMDETAARREILDAAARLQEWIGRPPRAFAWTYAWDEIGALPWRVARDRHEVCFSPCPGTCDGATDSPSLLWRTHVEARSSAAEVRFMYSGLVDRPWAPRRRRLRAMLGIGTVRE